MPDVLQVAAEAEVSRHQSDANAGPIIEALRDAGCVVWQVVGANGRRGFPDLVVAHRGSTVLLEIKLPLGPKGGKAHSELDEHQEAFFRNWTGGKLAVVRSVEDALRVVGLRVAA